MISATRLTSEEICDKGICNLMAAIIEKAREDYISAYIDYKYNLPDENNKMYDYMRKGKERAYKANKSFFQSVLFANALGAFSDMSVQTYIDNLELEAERLHRKGLVI